MSEIETEREREKEREITWFDVDDKRKKKPTKKGREREPKRIIQDFSFGFGE